MHKYEFETFVPSFSLTSPSWSHCRTKPPEARWRMFSVFRWETLYVWHLLIFQGFPTIISTQVRKLETELVDLNDKLKAEAPAAESGNRTVGETSKRILECQLKDYCKTKWELLHQYKQRFSAWDQSEKFVKLYLTGLSGLDKCPNDHIKVTYSR